MEDELTPEAERYFSVYFFHERKRIFAHTLKKIKRLYLFEQFLAYRDENSLESEENTPKCVDYWGFVAENLPKWENSGIFIGQNAIMTRYMAKNFKGKDCGAMGR